MLSEEKIRERIKGLSNQIENTKTMYEMTGSEHFIILSRETEIFVNALKYVLEEIKPKISMTTVDKNLNVTKD